MASHVEIVKMDGIAPKIEGSKADLSKMATIKRQMEGAKVIR